MASMNGCFETPMHTHTLDKLGVIKHAVLRGLEVIVELIKTIQIIS
jgi:hypothetical protein